MDTRKYDYIITRDFKDGKETDTSFHNINYFNQFVDISRDTVDYIGDISDTWNWKYRVVDGETILGIESQRNIELPDWHEAGCLSDLVELDMGSNNV